jgi:outer membrane receptor protein involved in Fe transport
VNYPTHRTLRLLAGVATSALFVASAHAQEAGAAAQPAANQQTTLGEIVVTAQKRSERLLDVPVAVSALPAQNLVQQNLVTITDYSRLVPGLNVAGTEMNQISLRGLNTGGSVNPSVAVTIDDVPFGSSSSVAQPVFPDLDPADLSRIEVLKGPQGTLYGAASLGGLIKLITNTPSATTFSGRLQLEGSHADGGGNGWAGRASVNVPIIEDRLAVRVSGFRRDDPAYATSIYAGSHVVDDNTARTEGFRAAVMAQPFDNFTINISHLQQQTTTQNSATTRLTPLPTDYSPLFGYFVTNLAPSNGFTQFKLTQVRGDLDLGWSKVSSISAWGKSTNSDNEDVTTTFPFVFAAIYPGSPPGSAVRLLNASTTSKFTQELRFASNSKGPFEWLAGGFYTREDSNTFQDVTADDPTGAPIGPVGAFPLPSTYTEAAIFGDLTYHFTEKFDLQVGARYAQNWQTFRSDSIVPDVAVPFFGPTAIGDLEKSNDHALTWLVTPRYKFSDDLMGYIRIATGYRPGGPNTVVPGVPATFGPDKVINYEIGAKGKALDGRLTFDVALYQINWRDIQLQVANDVGFAFFTNGGRARSRGAEVGVQFAPGGGWTFGANAAYTDAILTTDLPPPPEGGTGLIGPAGTRLPYTPKFSANLSADKKIELPKDMELTLHGDLSHIGERNSQLRSTAAPIERQGMLAIPAYNQLNLSAALDYRDITFSVYIRNAMDGRGLTNVDDRQGVVSAVNGYFTTPRTYGMSIAYKF